MSLSPEQLEVMFDGGLFGLSARRIHEHMTLEQINPFGRSLSSARTLHDAAELIDVVRVDSPGWFCLTGLTLAGLRHSIQNNLTLGDDLGLARLSTSGIAIQQFVAEVFAAVRRHAERRAIRNNPAPFLARSAASGPLGIPRLRSKLGDYLATHAKNKAEAVQWLGTIQNLGNRGLRKEELYRSGLLKFLEERSRDNAPLRGGELAQRLDFSSLGLSVIPNIGVARNQLHFEVVPNRRVPKVKDRAKPQAGQQRYLRFFDRVLGYRIEEVEHPTLWGNDRHWQAVTYSGTVLGTQANRRVIFDSSEAAMSRAKEHAREVVPKMLPSERWIDWAWTGGEEYREWLITLPYFPVTYLSTHFNVRNVLAHVRCDLREGADGEKILMLHEVQSDWMQEVRRALHEDGRDEELAEQSPFLHEWPALTLKLMLLHAASLGVDALAWTCGEHQARRYNGLGVRGLKELYDRTLPRDANRVLRPFGVTCETVDVYVPENFTIRRVDGTYQVCNAEGAILGSAATFFEAQALLPAGAHEQLRAVHGVRFKPTTRAAILEKGFEAWG